MEHVARFLIDREQYRPGGLDWQALTRAAWRVYLHHSGGLLTDTTPPPADFGPQYLTQQQAA